MTIEHRLHYRTPDEKDVFQDFTKLTLSSANLLALAREHPKSFGYTPAMMQLDSVYRKIAEYSSEFLLFTRTRIEPVLLPHDKFIGKPHERPVPLVQLINSTRSEHYFYPGDKRFVGRMTDFNILDLAMPYLNVHIREQANGTFSSGRSNVHVEAELDLEYWQYVNPEYVDSYPQLTRTEILQNLEFLLGFIPRERSQTINLNSLRAPSSRKHPKTRSA